MRGLSTEFRSCCSGFLERSIPERHAEGSCRRHEVVVEGYRLRLPDNLAERHGDQVRRVIGHHLPELPIQDQLDRLAAKAGRKRTVEGGRRAAALQMAEHDRTRLFTG